MRKINDSQIIITHSQVELSRVLFKVDIYYISIPNDTRIDFKNNHAPKTVWEKCLKEYRSMRADTENNAGEI